MAFINRNANMFLLFLIILSAVILVGATVFFQLNFDRLNSDYHQKVTQLQSVSSELDTQRVALSKIKEDLSTKTQREEVLGAKYTEVEQNKEQLQTQKTELETSKAQLETELSTTETTLHDAQAAVEAQKNQISQLTSDNEQLKKSLDISDEKRRKSDKDFQDCVTAKAKCTCPT